MKSNKLIHAAIPHQVRLKVKKRVRAVLAGSVVLGMLSFVGIAPASAAGLTVVLNTAGNYSVLAGTTINQTGISVLGPIGISPGISVTSILGGITGSNNNPAVKAQADLALAYSDAERRPATATVNAQLGGQRLTDGVYQSNTGAFRLDGTLTLDGQNDPNSVFILKADSLTTGAASRINLTNGAQACNVFFLVRGSAALGPNSVFAGTVLALDSITAQASAKVEGRLLAQTGAVNLNANVFTAPGCNKAVASAALNVPNLAPSVAGQSATAPLLSARAVTPPVSTGLAARVPALTPAASPLTGPVPAVPAPAEPPVTTPNDGSVGGGGIVTDPSTGTDANAGTGTGNGSGSVAGAQDDPAALASGNGMLAVGSAPLEQGYVTTGDHLAQTGAGKWIPAAIVAGLGLLLGGAVFLLLSRNHLPTGLLSRFGKG
jgi:LPXTG-motif cell wall-anchored protein